MEFFKHFQVIWADIDANRHMRHTAYNDYAAQVRLSFFMDHGLTHQRMEELKMGPILFREETLFQREVPMGDEIKVDILLAAMRGDGSKWKIVHNIFRRDGVQAALITVEGAWMDLVKRKVVAPTQDIVQIVERMPRSKDFQIIPDKK